LLVHEDPIWCYFRVGFDESPETRVSHYSIKPTASPSVDFDTAAREMAALITGPCWLVPIPDSNGNTDANTRLAHHIANHCPGAQVVKAIFRTQPVQSQCARHKLALGPIAPEQHHLARNRKVLTLRQTYFVDNVTTSGHTLEAARLALGFGAGLVFADARPAAPKCKPPSFEFALSPRGSHPDPVR
jgi:hypothetical protein